MAPLNFWNIARDEPERVALVDPAGHERTYGNLNAGCNQLVRGLRALGLQPGDAIAAMLPNSPEAMELHLAVQQAGWYLIPINFHLVGPEVAYLIKDSEAKVFVTHESFAPAALAATTELSFPLDHCFAVGHIQGFGAYEQLKAGQPVDRPPNRTLGMVMNYTSGTTGRPKGVRRPLPGTEPDDSMFGALRGYGIEPFDDNVHLLCCPWYHTAPLVMVNPSLHMGHKVVIMDRFLPERFLQLVQQQRVTVTHVVPTQFVRLLALPDEVRARYDISSFRSVIHGAAPCPPDAKRKMIEWFGPVLDEYYASTEGVGGTIVHSEDWLKKPGTVGKPRPEVEMLILDDSGNEVPRGQVGTIYTKSLRGSVEYFKDPEKTARGRHGQHFTVGDVGYLDEDGYLFLADRKIDMIISGGVNIYPIEIENVIIGHPKVLDVAVFGIPNEEWGEEIKAVIEPVPGDEAGPSLAADILAYCDGKMARYKLPKSIDFVAAMPRDPSGKLYKRKLREPYWQGRQRAI
ncbi:MAG: acyl-CoA synthetase [Chloroflexota bacterium]